MLALACALVGLVAAPSALASVGSQPPVPSLDPRGTQAEWQRLVHRPVFSPYAVEADCRPLRGVFYAQTDWLRLATKLAANASPCAQYSISVPPLVGRQDAGSRPDQAGGSARSGRTSTRSPRSTGARWQKWVASTGSSWYQAGVEARRRMAAAGYDVGGGRHVGGERALVRRRAGATATPARTCASSCAGCTTRRRRAGRRAAWSSSSASASAHRSRRYKARTRRVAAGQRVLVRHERVRRRLVAGGLRRRPQLRGAGCAARSTARRAQRVPPATRTCSPRPAAPSPGRRTRSYRDRLQPARERRLAVGLRASAGRSSDRR